MNTSSLDGKVLDGNALKIIAVVTMIIDHTGAALLPQYRVLRYIGRIAFPIFCFLLAEGAVYTHDIRRYMMRLGIFALVSELPFDLALHGRWFYPQYQNVFFTLLIGLVVIYAHQCADRKYGSTPQRAMYSTLAFVAGCIGAWVLRTDYSVVGVSMIYVFYIWRDRGFIKYIIEALLMACMSLTELFGIIAFIPMLMYNGRRGRKSKILQIGFYAVYPVHLLIIALIAYWL